MNETVCMYSSQLKAHTVDMPCVLEKRPLNRELRKWHTKRKNERIGSKSKGIAKIQEERLRGGRGAHQLSGWIMNLPVHPSRTLPRLSSHRFRSNPNCRRLNRLAPANCIGSCKSSTSNSLYLCFFLCDIPEIDRVSSIRPSVNARDLQYSQKSACN